MEVSILLEDVVLEADEHMWVVEDLDGGHRPRVGLLLFLS